ncbi:MAG: hypothetical protein QOI07_48 [Verrucomicrobiota bacterium]
MTKRSPSSFRIQRLRLSPAAQAYLHHRGIQYLHQLGQSIRIQGISRSTCPVFDELQNAIRALFASSAIDWSIYHRRLVQGQEAAVPLLPTRQKANWSAMEFVKALPAVAADAVKLQFSALHAEVLESRVLPSSAYQSLGEIAWTHKLSRSRVHKIEKRIVVVLQRALLDEDYRRCRFRFRTGFNYPLRTLGKKLDQRYRGARLRAKMWSDLLHRAWGLQRSDLKRCEGLILRVLGIALIQPRE